jgi:hypothetical protein
MPLWGKTDQANNKPQILTIANTSVFGVDATEAALKVGVAHPGWVKVTYGTGPVASLAVANGGTGYANGEALIFTGDGSDAAGTIGTNGSGVITSVTLSAGGTGYTTAPVVTVNTAAGTDAAFTVTMGGRSGRVHYETLVALKSVTGDASDDTTFPDS